MKEIEINGSLELQRTNWLFYKTKLLDENATIF
jgi:hypothetical protein